MKQHKVVEQVIHKRQHNLKTVAKWWTQANVNSTINTLTQLKDPSVVNDFFGETFARQERLEVVTLENCPAILAHCLLLINAKYTQYNLTGIKAYYNIFKSF
mmetsp:Transcript_42398/g.31047  ORF Transcript_42398/g.31047 Transcript_42398/m.31047 type:complete len:102 (+) Transcript_42398:302-607(+)